MPDTSFFIYRLQMFAPIRIGEYTGYAFVDTGASQLTLLSAYATTYPKRGTVQSRGALGGMTLEQCLVPSIHFLGEAFENVSTYVQGDLFIDYPPERTVLIRLGQDILTKRALHLDFDAR